MSHDRRGLEDRNRFGGSKVVVRETDEYLRRGGDNGEEREPPNKLIHNLLQPFATTILVGCVTWSVAQALAPLIASEMTGVQGTALFLWTISVLMTFVGFKTQRALHGSFASDRILSGSEALKARAIELGLLFFAVKLLNHLGDTLPDLLRMAQGWAGSPMTFFDARSLMAYGIGVVGWLAAGFTARDLDELVDPLQAGASAGDEADPRQRIVDRYFIGGGILLFFTAVNRVGVMSFVQFTHTRLRTPLASVLLYFFLGVLMLGHVQWLRLTSLWSRQKVKLAQDLAPTWLRYTLLFVALAALIAFLLPTGYTVGILDLVSMAISLIGYLVTLIYMLLLWPFILLMSLFRGDSGDMEPPQLDRLPFSPPPEATGAGGSPWWAVVRSVLFWITLLAVVIYLIRSYVRDRPGVLRAIRGFAPWKWLKQAWRGLRNWLGRMGDRLPGALPALVQRLRSAASRRRQRTNKRAQGLNAREQIIHYYLTTLDQAREWGLGRRQVETPYEYRETLAPNLVEGQQELDSLTEAFVAARYSTHRITPEEVQAQAANAASLRQQMRQERRDRREAESLDSGAGEPESRDKDPTP
jgi:hypothetical protein